MTDDLFNILAQNYNIDLSNPIPYRDGFLVDNLTEPYSLHIRKSDLSADRIMFNHISKTHLISQGFSNTDKYIVTNDGLPYLTIDNQIYVITTKVSGIEACFENPADLGRSAIILAKMHVSSIGGLYDFEKYPFAIRDLGKLPELFSHRLNELKKFRKLAAKGKSFFDYEYTKNAGYFIEDAESAIEELSKSKYTSMVAKTLEDNLICHHDFTSHNVIFHNNNTYLMGFDNCCIEIKEYDIANFIRRKMRRTGWSLPDAGHIINNYRSICKLNENDLEVLRIILKFPQKLWRIVNKFYNSRRSWCERGCLEKMSDVLTEREPLKLFLDNFDILY